MKCIPNNVQCANVWNVRIEHNAIVVLIIVDGVGEQCSNRSIFFSYLCYGRATVLLKPGDRLNNCT